MSPEYRSKFKRIVWPLAIAQTVLWAGAFYLFPSMLGAWERDMGWSKPELTGAFTAALLLSAFLAPLVGRAIDRGYSRAIFPLSSLTAAGLLALLSVVDTLWQFYAIWAALGVVMAGSLYEPCFAILTRHMGTRARQAITMVTLLAGFAGTIAFPTAHALIDVIGWRGVVLVFAGLIAVVAAPLNFYAVSQTQTVNPAPPEPPAPLTGEDVNPAFYPTLWFLGVGFAMMAFNHGAVIAHLLPILDERGISTDVAVLGAAMIGPMQVMGRLGMIALEKNLASVGVALLGFMGLGLAALALMATEIEPMFLVVFVLFQGAGFGVVSILRPILVAELLGRRKFGVIAGFLAIPFLVAFAAAPSLAGALWSFQGYNIVILCAGFAALIGAGAIYMADKRAPEIEM